MTSILAKETFWDSKSVKVPLIYEISYIKIVLMILF